MVCLLHTSVTYKVEFYSKLRSIISYRWFAFNIITCNRIAFAIWKWNTMSLPQWFLAIPIVQELITCKRLRKTLNRNPNRKSIITKWRYNIEMLAEFSNSTRRDPFGRGNILAIFYSCHWASLVNRTGDGNQINISFVRGLGLGYDSYGRTYKSNPYNSR